MPINVAHLNDQDLMRLDELLANDNDSSAIPLVVLGSKRHRLENHRQQS
jgi:hypothetical protein